MNLLSALYLHGNFKSKPRVNCVLRCGVVMQVVLKGCNKKTK